MQKINYNQCNMEKIQLNLQLVADDVLLHLIRQYLIMSEQQRNFYTILEQPTETVLKIKENIPESTIQEVEIAQTGSAKTEDGKPASLFRTTHGRNFVQLEEWPNSLLLEVQQQASRDFF